MGKKRRGRPRKQPPVATEFSRRLRRIMKTYGVTRKEVAAAARVSLRTVYAWLGGREPIHADAIMAKLESVFRGRGL